MQDNKKKSGLAILIGMGGSPKGDSDKKLGESPSPQSTDGKESYGAPEGQYIKPPEGFQPPSDKRSGETFTGTFRAHMDEDGNLCFDAINDIPMGKESEETSMEEEMETPKEEEKEQELGMEEEETPEEESPSSEDNESTARQKFNKAFGRKR